MEDEAEKAKKVAAAKKKVRVNQISI